MDCPTRCECCGGRAPQVLIDTRWLCVPCALTVSVAALTGGVAP